MNHNHTATAARGKLTSQLAKGDAVKIGGLGTFAIAGIEPYGTEALIRLDWENLAVIAGRNARWPHVTPGIPVYLHGYSPCRQCRGKGIVWD